MSLGARAQRPVLQPAALRRGRTGRVLVVLGLAGTPSGAGQGAALTGMTGNLGQAWRAVAAATLAAASGLGVTLLGWARGTRNLAVRWSAAAWAATSIGARRAWAATVSGTTTAGTRTARASRSAVAGTRSAAGRARAARARARATREATAAAAVAAPTAAPPVAPPRPEAPPRPRVASRPRRGEVVYETRTPIVAWFARLTALGASGVVLVVVLGLVASTLATAAARNATEAVAWELSLPAPAEFAGLEERSVVIGADGALLATLHERYNRVETPLDSIPQHLIDAVLAAEDRKFWEHEGYDPEGIARAALANLQAGGVAQGGSTITQQLAKAEVGDDVTFERKAQELLQAIALEEAHTKEELLERYVNQIYFGSGAYGVRAAAEEFFGVDPSDLRIEQAAMLAGVIRSPGFLNPRVNPDEVTTRRNSVLAGMATEGYISEHHAERLAALPLGVVPASENRPTDPYLVEAVKAEFLNSPAFGETRQDRYDALFFGGLEIHTTVDRRLQDAAEAMIRAAYPEGDGVTAAIASVDPSTGAVLAAAFGRDFDDSQVNIALSGRRQPGSAAKPYVAAAALQQGLPRSINLEGSNNATFEASGDPQWREEGVRNFGGSSFGRPDLDQAMRSSVNTAFAQLVLITGVDPVVELLDRLGVNTNRATGGNATESISLGGFEWGITPLEMASAYGAFANSGAHRTPHVIARVLDRDGEEIYNAESLPSTEAVRPEVAAAMTDMLMGVVSGGTGTGARIPGWDVAGKTGTSQEQRDAWFVGYTPNISTAVWVGHPTERVLLSQTGGGAAAPLWRQFMEVALEGMEPQQFDFGDVDTSVVETGEQVGVPDLSGMDEIEAIRTVIDLRLVPEVVATASGAPAGQVIWQSPRGGETSVGSTVRIGVSTGVPPPPPPPEEEEEEEDDAEDGDGGEDGPGEGGEEPPPPAPDPDPDPGDGDGDGEPGDGEPGDDGPGDGGDDAGEEPPPPPEPDREEPPADDGEPPADG